LIDSKPVDGTGGAVLLAHADRCWKAEEANAARLATRANLVLSAITAILGLKLFAIGKEIEVVIREPFGAWSLFFWIAGSIGFVAILNALRQILGIQFKSKKSSASASLSLAESVAESPWKVAPGDATWYIFKVTYNASLSLRERNEEKQNSIRRSQVSLGIGVVALAISIVCFTIISLSSSRSVP
jgi:hypothetical protein